MAIEILEDEVDKKKKELREKFRQSGGRPQFDQTEVRGKKPGYHYRGANKDPRRMASFEAMGYELVRPEDPEDWTVNTGGKDDSLKLYGEQALIRIPHDKYVENLAMAELKQEEREGAFMDDTRERMNRMYREEVGPRRAHAGDITFNDSHTGKPEEKTVVRPKEK